MVCYQFAYTGIGKFGEPPWPSVLPAGTGYKQTRQAILQNMQSGSTQERKILWNKKETARCFACC